jgi:virginiamycin A acetyltransferase
MLVFDFKKPINIYTMQKSSTHFSKLVVPKWYSHVDMGEHSFINDETRIHSFRKPQTVKIGKYSSIGRCDFIVDGDHDHGLVSTFPFNELGLSKTAPESCKKIDVLPTIGNDCWICDGTVLIGNVNIGDGAVVAAHAVVTKDVPPYAIVAGNPARIVKYRFPKDVVDALLDIAWWDMDHDFVCTMLAPSMGDIQKFMRIATYKQITKS